VSDAEEDDEMINATFCKMNAKGRWRETAKTFESFEEIVALLRAGREINTVVRWSNPDSANVLKARWCAQRERVQLVLRTSYGHLTELNTY
jgi:hypothetical protein